MKRLFCLLLALAGLLCACGRTDTPARTTAGTSSNPPETTAAREDTVQLPMISVSAPLMRQETKNQAGQTVFTQITQDFSVIAPDADAAAQVVLNLLRLADGGQDTAEALRQQALADESAADHPYRYQLLYSPMRIDEKVLSLFGAETTDMGGVHPNRSCLSLNFDMATGEQLHLSDILENADAAVSLSQLIIENLSARKQEDQLYDGYASLVSGRYSGEGWEDCTAWYLSAAGFCAYFSPYELAPYVAGQIVVEIPYGELDGILRADFRPAALPDRSGTPDAALAQDVDPDRFRQYSEAILDPNGERVLLFADDLISDVTLEQGDWAEDGSFLPLGTVFMARSLCSGDAVTLQLPLTGADIGLRLRWTAGGQAHTARLQLDSADSTVRLTDIP